MTTLTRKQREFQHREEQILELALEMLLADGYLGLSMDRIADALEYSKGTIYQHFPNKEEILLALATRAHEERVALFRRAAAFRGLSRERMLAIGVGSELFNRLYPHHFRVEHVIRLSSVWEKTSEERRNLLRTCETQCVGTVGGIVRDGVVHGDVELPDDTTPEELVFGLWAMAFGAQTIEASSTSLADLGIRDPFEALRKGQTMLLDGWRWRPLSHEHDYEAATRRIENEVFASEVARLRSA